MTEETAPYSTIVDDTIDLRPYFMALFRWWPLIIGLAIVAMLLAGLISAVTPPMYEAKVSVAILSYKTKFELEPTMETVTDVGAQRKALASLVANASIAEEVMTSLGDRLPEDYRDVGVLVDMVSGEALQDTDLVDITVRCPDPQVSVMVAEAWASAYEKHINEVYAGAAPYVLEALAAQTETARAEYEAAQQALVAYTAENPVGLLERLVREKQAALDARLVARTSSLQEYLGRRVQLQRLRQSAASLLAVARDGGASSTASNSTAIAVLKTRAFAWLSENKEEAAGFTLQLGLSPTAGTPQEQVADLTALVAALDREMALTDEAIAAASAPSSPEDASGTAALEEELRALQAELETAGARYDELTRDRDLALETYTAVTRKLSEQRVESGLTKEIVRVASASLLPKQPAGRGLASSLAIAAVIGLVLGIVIVLFITYLFPDVTPPRLRGKR